MNRLAHTTGPEHLADDLEQALDAAPSAVRSGVTRSDIPKQLLVKPTVPKLLRMAGEEWLLLALIWAGMALAPAWAYPPLALLAAGRLHALGIILHDACHMPQRHKPLGMRLLELLCGFPMATTVNAMRYHHLRHHRDSGMPTDPYFKRNLQGRPLLWTLNTLRGLLLIPFWTVRPVFGVLALLRPGMRNAYGRVFLQDRSGEELTHSRELLDCARADLWQLGFQALVISALVVAPRPLVFAYVIPVSLTGLTAAWRLLVEHNYEPATDRRLETIFRTTNDHHLRWVDKLLLAPRNIGYHVAHHIHPQVCLTHLPEVRAWYLRARGSEPPP